MSWHYDPFKPMSEKTAADWATDYMIYEDVTKGRTSGGGGTESPKPQEASPSGDSTTGGCGCGFLAILIVLIFALFPLWVESCGTKPIHHQVTTYTYYTTSTTTSTTARSSSRYPTSYRYTTRRYTTRYDAYGVHDYVDAEDFADEMAEEEFDGDWEEAYEYYEEHMG